MNKFNGKIFVISGKHPYLTHVQIIRMIRQNGGKVKSNFTKDVNYLVTTLEDFQNCRGVRVKTALQRNDVNIVKPEYVRLGERRHILLQAGAPHSNSMIPTMVEHEIAPTFAQPVYDSKKINSY